MRASMWRLGVLAGLSVVAGAGVGACLLPDITVGETSPPEDAGPDVTVSGCMHASYPGQPKVVNPTDGPELVFAVRSVLLGESGDSPPGLDLDGKCTCYELNNAADAGDAGPVDPEETCSTTLITPKCDGPGGIDSATSGLFKQIAMYMGTSQFGSKYYSQRAEAGFWTMLIKVAGYGGGADDPEVKVTVFMSPGLGGMPKWNGEDAWPVSSQSFIDSGGGMDGGTDGGKDGGMDAGSYDMPSFVADGAYVANYTLVAALPAVAFRISTAQVPFNVRMVGGVLVGKLVLDEKPQRLDSGVLAGRWPTSELFATLSSFEVLGAPICTGSFAYPTVKGVICDARDILANAAGSKGAPCDSLSLGIGFQATAAKLGSVVLESDPASPCSSGQDPSSDMCP